VPNPKLLLADDSIAIRKVVELTFADEGIEVYAVPDAQGAMQKFVEVQPDVVLIDAGLDGTSGYHICEMIKQDEQTRHIPVLLLVGSFEPFDHAAAERAGADGFLTKPFQSIRELVDRVTGLLSPPEPIVDSAEGQMGGGDPDGNGAEGDTAEEMVSGELNDTTTTATSDATTATSDATTATSDATTETSDTVDIDNLYNSSFEKTAEIEEFDTVEDTFGDDGLDDELIETTRPPSADETADPAEDFSQEAFTHVQDEDEPDAFKSVKEFDWSPASTIDDEEDQAIGHEPIDGDEVGAVEQAPPAESSEPVVGVGEERWAFADTVSNLDASSVGEGGESGPFEESNSNIEEVTEETPAEETVSTVDAAAPCGIDAEPIVDTESPVRLDTENRLASGEFPSTGAFDAFAYGDVTPVRDEVHPPIDLWSAVNDGAGVNGQSDTIYPPIEEQIREPSPELITLLAQRVIERLSDKVIREVAEEAVPKIAEKLIREALEEEGKH
jgi:CheY-like chemotaxis protein